jgi:hypothetical protein
LSLRGCNRELCCLIAPVTRTCDAARKLCKYVK